MVTMQTLRGSNVIQAGLIQNAMEEYKKERDNTFFIAIVMEGLGKTETEILTFIQEEQAKSRAKVRDVLTGVRPIVAKNLDEAKGLERPDLVLINDTAFALEKIDSLLQLLQ